MTVHMQKHQYSLQPTSSPTDESTSSSLLCNNKPTGITLSGCVLEHVHVYSDKTLLILSDGVVFEEQLHLYLLNIDNTILDTARISAPYCDGIFHLSSDSTPNKPNTCHFNFIGNGLWHITILDRYQWRRPFSEPSGVHRQWGWRHAFRVSYNNMK